MNSTAISARFRLTVTVLLALSACLFHSAIAWAEDDLVTAARTGNVALAKKTVRRGGDVNAVGQYGRTVLHIAAVNDHAEMVAFLIEAGADVNKHEGDNVPPLIAMVSSGNAEISRLLLAAGADLTVTKGKWNDPISVLADWSNPELAKLLKGYEVDINAPNKAGITVAHQQTQAMLNKLNYFVAKTIQDSNYDRTSEFDEALRRYRAYFDAGADPDAGDKAGRTPLMMLARSHYDGVLEASRVLLEVGADPNVRDADGKTALDIATRASRMALVALLTEHGANPNSDPLALFNSLHQLGTAQEKLSLLLAAGADPNTVAQFCLVKGEPRIDCAEQGPGAMASRHILLYTIMTRMSWPERIRNQAAHDGNLDIIRLLLDAGADPNTGIQKNALWFALKAGAPGLVKLLLEFGAGLGGMGPSFDRQDTTVYLPHAPYRLRSFYTDDYAQGRRWNKRQIVTAFLESGTDPNDAHPETGMTPLRIAVTWGELGIVRALIAAGAEVTGDTLDGVSLLAAAVSVRTKHKVKAVCSGPGDTSDNCQNVRQFARDHHTIVEELLSAGAAPATVVGEDVRRLVVQATMLARQAKSPTDYLRVVREFGKAQKLAPTWPDIYYKLAAVHEAREDFPEALVNYELYLALAPGAANWREIQDKVYELEVRAKNYVSHRDILGILMDLGRKDSGWRFEGSDRYRDRRFEMGKGGVTLRWHNGARGQQTQIPVNIKHRTVSWKGVFYVCGSMKEYNDCPSQVSNLCEVRSPARIDCTIETFNDWPRHNSGMGPSGGKRFTTRYSWVKGR